IPEIADRGAPPAGAGAGKRPERHRAGSRGEGHSRRDGFHAGPRARRHHPAALSLSAPRPGVGHRPALSRGDRPAARVAGQHGGSGVAHCRGRPGVQLPDVQLGMITEADVRAALSEVSYPGLRRDIVSLGMLRSVSLRDEWVHVSLMVSTERAEVPDLLRNAVTARVALAGAVRTEVQLLTPGRKPVERDPWRKQDRLSNARSVIAVGAG